MTTILSIGVLILKNVFFFDGRVPLSVGLGVFFLFWKQIVKLEKEGPLPHPAAAAEIEARLLRRRAAEPRRRLTRDKLRNG